MTGHIGSVPTCLCSFPVRKVTAPPLDVGVWLHTPHFVVSRHSVCNGQFRSRDHVTSHGLCTVSLRWSPVASQNSHLKTRIYFLSRSSFAQSRCPATSLFHSHPLVSPQHVVGHQGTQ